MHNLVFAFILTVCINSSIVAQFTDVELLTCHKKETEKANFFVIDFWATYCKPCIRAFPHMNRLHENLERKDVQFLSLTNEPAEVVSHFLENVSLKSCVGIDHDFTLMKSFGFRFIPEVVIIDRNNTVLWQGKPLDLNLKTLNQVLEGVSKPDSRGNVFTEVKITGPTTQDSSSIMLQTKAGNRSMVFQNKPIGNIIKNILGWKDKSSYFIHYSNSPTFRSNLNFSCTVDTTSFNEKEFYSFCYRQLAAAYDFSIRDTFIKSEVIFVDPIDSSELNTFLSEKSTFRVKEDGIETIFLEGVSLEKVFDIVSYYYDRPVKYNFPTSSIPEMKYDLAVPKLSMDTLIDTFREYGINLSLGSGKKKDFVVTFKE